MWTSLAIRKKLTKSFSFSSLPALVIILPEGILYFPLVSLGEREILFLTIPLYIQHIPIPFRIILLKLAWFQIGLKKYSCLTKMELCLMGFPFMGIPLLA